jgi:pyridoxine 5-phosphate synthase
MMIRLGVNIDHVATLRQARKTTEPDPVRAAVLVELGGADSITVHLREDRRHICDRDVRLLAATITTPLNLEMAVWREVIDIALELKPWQCTLVPERREEVTTEGGLDVVSHFNEICSCVMELKAKGIRCALFIDPVEDVVRASVETGADAVEFHTGAYANAIGTAACFQLDRLFDAAACAVENDIAVHAGHGLNYLNIAPVLEMPGIEEVNIGHAIVSRSVFTGLERAVREMKGLINRSC